MSQRYIGGLIYNPPGGFSGYFDGSGDYLSVGDQTAFEFGSGDYTVELWWFPTGSSNQNLIGKWDGGGSEWILQWRSAGYYRWASGGSVVSDSATMTLALNTWNHVVVTKTGTSLRIYTNGSQINTTATEGTISATGAALTIGDAQIPSSPAPVTGYISNVRILKGTALYTSSTYTVPSGQLQAITNTSLLTCAYPTFRDGSSNNFTITVNGNTAVSTQNPFPLTQLPNPALGNQGNGVYSMSQYQALRSQNLWPAIDPYFDYVTLLLHGNGTNGAQNNTFLDSSTNNYTITRNGNTTQGTFTPYGDNWSNTDFSNSNFLTCNPGAGAAFGTGDFTVEAWAFATAALSGGDNPYICDTRAGGGAWLFSWNPTGGSNPWQLAWYNGSTLQPSVTMSLNTWNHCAYVRSGTTGTLYLNGVAIGSWTDNFNYSASVTTLHIGRRFTISGGTTQYFPGYLSNFRIVKGTAVYTTNFTPPTAPLTAITNTQLLTCQSNRFIDNSSNALAITVNGSPSVQRFSPFNPSASYSAATIGGSGYFDGSGDYLTLAPGAAFAFGTGDFTVEAWIYPTAAPGQMYIIDARNSGQTSTWSFNFAYGGTSNEFNWGSSGSVIANGGTTSVIQNAWNHVVYTRSGTSGALFANGVRVASVTDSTNYSTSPTTSYIGSRFSTDAPYFFQGYMAVRVVKGTAVYSPSSSTLTVPTSPLTAVTNTVLLLSMTNGGIIDNAMMNDLETVGNAQISTSVSKFGGGSIFFDGSGDYLSTVDKPMFALGSGEFTMEAWVYPTALPGSNAAAYILAQLDDAQATSNQAFQFFIYNSAGTLQLYATLVSGSTGYNLAGNFTFSTNTWYHVAFTRASGGVTRLFVNGNQVGSDGSANVSVNDSTTNLTVGCRLNGGAAQGAFTGYIDDLRITKYARYTANFTPQRSQWQDQ